MLICWNAEGEHDHRKVEGPWSRTMAVRRDSWEPVSSSCK